MKQQLEIGLETNRKCPRARRGQQRRIRARWWFDQMRSVVDSAVDWRNASAAEQGSLALQEQKS